MFDHRLTGGDRVGWSGAAHSAHVLRVLAAREAIEAELVLAVGAWDASGAWAEEGAASPVGWLRSTGGMPEAAAARLVRTARLAREHAPTGEALRTRRVSTPNLALIADAVRDREDAYRENPDLLLEPAATFSPDEFRRVTRYWRDTADDQLAGKEAHEQFERRYLHASVTLAGMVALDGLLDPEGGALLLAALDTVDHPDPSDGVAPARGSAQRRADALVDVCRTALDAERGAGRSPVTLDVVVDLATLAPEAHAALATRQCDLGRVGPIPHVVMQRLACDCAVGRVIVNGRSEILDLGRRQRLVSSAQRRALSRRDGSCRFPGCERPDHWCDAHLLLPWEAGGPTDLDNLALLCRRHHVLCHDGGWTLARGPDGTFVATPPRHSPPGPPRTPTRPEKPDRFSLAA